MINVLLGITLMLVSTGVIYLVRVKTCKDQAKMVRFLARRFEIVRKSSSEELAHDYIDAAMIRRWGKKSLALLVLPLVVLLLSWGNPFLSWMHVPLHVMLIFSALIIADSLFGIYALKKLGISRYERAMGMY